MQTGSALVNRFYNRIKCFAGVFGPVDTVRGLDLPRCSNHLWVAAGLWIRRGSDNKNPDNSAAKQRLTVKAARAYNPRLPETAGTTSSVDVALKVVFALEGWA